MTSDSSRPDLRPPLPLTVIGGFLGAGKTTLINRLLTRDGPQFADDRKLAVVVNDFGAIDVDGRLIAAVHDDVVTLTNGCICCTIRDGVAHTVLRLAERSDRPDHVLIEASGTSEPGALAEVFIEMQKAGFVRLDGLVSVVDADAFDPDDPAQGRLARAQVAQADLLILTKQDLASADRIAEVKAKIRTLNPNARIIEQVEPSLLLGLRDKAVNSAETSGTAAHHHFHTAHLRIDEPVSFRDFLPRLTSLPTAIYRAKGWLNLKERPGDKILVHVVGRRIHIRTIGPWADQATDTPRTELVFIGATEGWDPRALTDHLTPSPQAPPGPEVPDEIDLERKAP